jgi:hypothetical protein
LKLHKGTNGVGRHGDDVDRRIPRTLRAETSFAFAEWLVSFGSGLFQKVDAGWKPPLIELRSQWPERVSLRTIPADSPDDD